MKISKKTLTTSIATLTILGTSAVVLANQKDHGDSDEASLVQNAKLGIEQAIAIALKDRPGKVFEAEIDKEDGVIVWEIELVDNQNQTYEYEIDANSGTILENERDDD